MYNLMVRIWNAILALLLRSDAMSKAIAELRSEQLAQHQTLQKMESRLEQLATALIPEPADHFKFTVSIDGQITQGEGSMASQMRTDQKLTVTIKPVNRLGQPAPVDGVPVWQSSNSDIAVVTPSEDGMTAEVAAVFAGGGSVSIAVTADADMGEGVTTISGSLDIEITAAPAVGIEITAGEPTDL